MPGQRSVVRASLVAVALGGGAALPSVAAFAQIGAGAGAAYPVCTGRSPTSQDVAAAKKTFELGSRYLSEADYDRAIQYFGDAYRSDCTAHKLLGYIARAHELRGDRAEAVRALETYLERAPHGDDRGVVEKRIANLRAQLARVPPEAGAAEAGAPLDAGNDATPSVPPEATTEDARNARSALSPTWPWVLAGTGAAVMLAGGIVSVIGGSAIGGAEAACPGRECVAQPDVDRGNSGRSTQVAGNVVLGVGGAIIAGAAVGWLLERRAIAAPAVGPGYAGVRVEGRF